MLIRLVILVAIQEIMSIVLTRFSILHYRVYIAADKDSELCALSIYFVHSSAIKSDCIISIPNPVLDMVKVTLPPMDGGSNGKSYQYPRVPVKKPGSIFVNDGPIPPDGFSSPEISVEVFSM